MRRFFLSFAVAMAALVSGSLSARADAVGPTLAPIDWTGAYGGISAGYGFGTSEHYVSGSSSGNYDVTGGLVGLETGYNWAAGPAILGIEADISLSSVDGRTTTGCTNYCETKLKWLGTLRARAGYPMGKFMPYITGGLSVGRVRGEINGPVSNGSNSETRWGWNAGGGLAYAFTSGFSVKAEYLYTDLGEVDVLGIPSGTIKAKADNFQIVRMGLDFAF